MIKKYQLRRSWRGRTIFKVLLRFIWDLFWLRLQRVFRGAGSMDSLRENLYRRQAVKLRETAILLGGLWVKLGQFFSTRVDLLPREYTEELSKLQNEVPPEGTAGIVQVIESEFGKPLLQIFSSFEDQVTAAASLGQVHRAVLPTGELVAVKVLRPGIEDIVKGDLKTLQNILLVLELITDWGRRYDLAALYREFSSALLTELDYLQEGRNCEKLSANLPAEAPVKTPKIYWNYTRQRVLTMEYLEGFKITDLEHWPGLVPPKQVVAQLVESYLSQILEHGFFHADPHPGNILVLPDGKIGLIDFGMVGQVSTTDKRNLKNLLLAFATQNSPGMVKAFLDLGFLRPETDAVVVRRALDRILERVHDMPLGKFTNEQWLEIVQEFEDVVRAEPFQIPSAFIFLGRTLGTLFGLCVLLLPDTPFFSLLDPHLRRLTLSDEAGAVLEQYLKKAAALAGTLLEIPGLLQRTLSLAEQGNLHLKVDNTNTAPILRSQERALRFLGRAIIFAALLITAVIMYINKLFMEAHVYLALALIVGMFLLLGWRGGDRHKDFRRRY